MADHLAVVLERLLSLQPHLHVELVDEGLDAAVEVVLPRPQATAIASCFRRVMTSFLYGSRPRCDLVLVSPSALIFQYHFFPL
jgi:hypothetical protein